MLWGNQREKTRNASGKKIHVGLFFLQPVEVSIFQVRDPLSVGAVFSDSLFGRGKYPDGRGRFSGIEPSEPSRSAAGGGRLSTTHELSRPRDVVSLRTFRSADLFGRGHSAGSGRGGIVGDQGIVETAKKGGDVVGVSRRDAHARWRNSPL